MKLDLTLLLFELQSAAPSNISDEGNAARNNFSGPRGTDANLSAKNWNQQQNNDGYSTQNWVNPNPQQPTASQWSPSEPTPDYGFNSNDSEQIQIKPRRWF